MQYAVGIALLNCLGFKKCYKRAANTRTSLRGAGDEAISCNKEQIASLTLAMTADKTDCLATLAMTDDFIEK
ncbi:MAG: hypothetical protein ACK5IQ_00980 [Bacteroidales bacterium]